MKNDVALFFAKKCLTNGELSRIIIFVAERCSKKSIDGELAEWSKAHDWKSCVR